MKRYRYIDPGVNRETMDLPAMNPASVELLSQDAKDWMAYAIELAKQIRYVTPQEGNVEDYASIVAAASDDWSGFLGPKGGELQLAFEAFIQDPQAFADKVPQPLAQPHVALLIAFVRLLEHAKKELNHFSSRHLDHYYQVILEQKPKVSRPASAFVHFLAAEGTNGAWLPKGTTLLASLPDASEPMKYQTSENLEVHPASLESMRSQRLQYEPHGFRAILRGEFPEQEMAVLRSLVWEKVGPTLESANVGSSFQAIFDSLSDRESRQNFPVSLLQLSIEEYLAMLTYRPTKGGLLTTEQVPVLRNWEFLHAYYVLRGQFPEIGHKDVLAAVGFSNKLLSALFLGESFPPYRNLNLAFDRLYADAVSTTDPQAVRVAKQYIEEVLFLEVMEFVALFEMEENRQTLDPFPAAIKEAVIRKAMLFEPMCTRRLVDEVVVNPDLDEVRKENVVGGWHPFGNLEEKGAQRLSFRDFGLVMESPQLLMTEGQRNIRLSLTFGEMDFAAFMGLFDFSLADRNDWRNPFKFSASTEKAWQSLDWRNTTPEIDAEAHKITFFLSLGPDDVALDKPGKDFINPDLSTMGPMLRIQISELRNLSGAEEKHARAILQSLRLQCIDIEMEVSGISQFVLENQDGELDPASPFKPFGETPGPGTYLHLGHKEICFKQIDELDIQMEWMDKPEDFGDYYASYFQTFGTLSPTSTQAIQNSDFNAKLEIVGSSRILPVLASATEIMVEDLHLPWQHLPAPELRADKFEANDYTELKEWPRSLRISYQPNWFPSQEYEKASRRLNNAISRASMKLSSDNLKYSLDTANAGLKAAVTNAAQQLSDLTEVIIEPPYVPLLKSMRLGYRAKLRFDCNFVEQPKPSDQLYHKRSYVHERLPIGIGVPLKVFPQLEEEGTFSIAIKNWQADKELSVLLKVKEGSGKAAMAAPSMRWAYHSSSGWRNLPVQNLLEDGTLGLTQTGILKFRLPADAELASMGLAEACHWLRASISANADAIPLINDLHFHALKAEAQEGQGLSGNAWYLPGGSIEALESNVSGIQGVVQPYPSANGRPAEAQGEYYRRVSERLRHKGRAISSWDFERLVMAEFPSVFAVKTVQSYAAINRKPGVVEVIVVPDLRRKEFVNPYQPKLGIAELREIKEFLEQKSSTFAKIQVQNPEYVQLVVDTMVKFAPGMSASMGKYLLHERLKQFLAPWAFNSGAKMAFGGRLYVNQIVEVIQSEEYVDYVGKTKIFWLDVKTGLLREANQASEDGAAYIEVMADAVLTSADRHMINEIEEGEAKNQYWSGISWMVINTDFEIASEPEAFAETFEEFMGVSWMMVAHDLQFFADNE